MAGVEPQLTVIVPTRDRPQLLDSALRHLNDALAGRGELIVVDSASERGDEVRLVAERRGARYLRADRPGASLARNLGWLAATASVVAFVDDDICVDRGWSLAVLTALDDPAVSFVTGPVTLPAEQIGCVHPTSIQERVAPVRLDLDTRGTMGGTCNLAVRRHALETVGGLDERLGPATWFASAEDLDLFDRLLESGFVGRYEPAMRVVHPQWRDRSEVLRVEWRYGKGAGARLAKVARRNPRRARWLAKEVLWDGGVRAITGSLAERYRFGVLAGSVRSMGTLLGFGVALVRLTRDR
jgi:GT2 family glycosyltransferase